MPHEEAFIKILVIDDNPMDIEIATRSLKKRLNVQIESVHTAEEAIRRLQMELFDLAIVDYSLPGQNGLDFLRDIQPLHIEVPVILMTSRGDQKIYDLATQEGAVDCISKDELLSPYFSRIVEAAAEHERALRAIQSKQKAEELRHNAEIVINSLEQRLELLEATIGSNGNTSKKSLLESFSLDKKQSTFSLLTKEYTTILKQWMGDPKQEQQSRILLNSFIAELFHLGASSEHLVQIHTSTCQQLRNTQWEMPVIHNQNKTNSPKILLLEASLSLLDAYRRATFSV